MNSLEQVSVLFKIIGAIKNYTGGFDLEKGIVQNLHRNCSDNMNTFKYFCDQFFMVSRINSDLKTEIKSSTRIAIYSKIICQEIALNCKIDDSTMYDVVLFSKSLLNPVKSYSDERDLGLIQRKSFIEGVACSHLIDGRLIFHNEYEKAILTHRILSEFADDNDVIEMKSYFAIPHCIVISVDDISKYLNFEEK